MVRWTVLIAIMALVTIPAKAQPGVAPPARYGAPIEVEQALSIIRRGIAISAAKGSRMAFAVVEPSGELVAFAKMDDTLYGSVRLAQQKARTSARLRMATKILEERVQGGRVVLLSSDEVVAIGGGVPIVVDGKVVGALGVSGGTAAEDAAIAEAMIGQ